MAEIAHPGSWLGDAVEEFKKLPPAGKIAVGVVILGVAGLAFYEWRQSAQGNNASVGGSLVPGGSSEEGAASSPRSIFPNVASGNENVPLLPSGVNPIYGPGGGLVGFQSPPGSTGGANSPGSSGSGTPTGGSTGGTKGPPPPPPPPKKKPPEKKPPKPSGGNSKPPNKNTGDNAHSVPKPPVSSTQKNQTPRTPGLTSYTVKPGDTLTSIGGRYGVGWQNVYRFNQATIGSDPNLIRPGQKLQIPTSGYYHA